MVRRGLVCCAVAAVRWRTFVTANGPAATISSRAMQTLAFLLLLYLKYSLIVLAIGIVVAGGLWCWLGLASFARRAREDV